MAHEVGIRALGTGRHGWNTAIRGCFGLPCQLIYTKLIRLTRIIQVFIVGRLFSDTANNGEMTLFQAAFLAAQLAASDPRTPAAAEATFPDADAQMAASSFKPFFGYMTGETAQGFQACIPAQNADAHLSRVTSQVRQALDLLDSEMQSGAASPKVRAAYRLLLNDEDMQMARYLAQTIADNTCLD